MRFSPGDATQDEVPPGVFEILAHELFQPLSAARGAIATLTTTREEVNLDKGDVVLLLGMALRNLDQLATLIDSLRVFSSVESGQWDLELTQTSMRSILREALEDFPNERTHRRLVLDCPVDFDVDVDLTYFRQVVANLVSNACKFSAPGSEVTIAVEREGNDVLFSVHDTGKNLQINDVEKIFEKSVRLQPSKRGLGLGLFVAKSIVMAHGGRIWADVSDDGTSFLVALPASQAA